MCKRNDQQLIVPQCAASTIMTSRCMRPSRAAPSRQRHVLHTCLISDVVRGALPLTCLPARHLFIRHHIFPPLSFSSFAPLAKARHLSHSTSSQSQNNTLYLRASFCTHLQFSDFMRVATSDQPSSIRSSEENFSFSITHIRYMYLWAE